MSTYFEIAERKGAVLLDASNFRMESYPIMTCIKDAFDRLKSGKVELGYDDPAGSYSLRELVALHESNYEGTGFSKEDIVVNSGGVTGSFDSIFRYLKKESENNGKNEIIIPIPAYPEIERGVIYNGLKPVLTSTYFENRFQPNVKDIQNCITEKTSCIFLTSPGNPCCSYINQNTLEDVINLAESSGIVVVLDAIFEEATRNPRSHNFFSTSNYSKLIKIKGPSKDRPHMNDFRIGWSISRDPSIVKSLNLASEVAGFCVSKTIDEIMKAEMRLRASMDVGATSPEALQYSEELDSFFNKIKQGVNSSLELCQNHPVVEKVCLPEAGNIFFLKINKDYAGRKGIGNAHELFEYILETTNIGITPGHIFQTKEEELWFRTTMSMDPTKFTLNLRNVLDSLK
ncbi:aminotransferase class I/II-fold pyridoxal phosphate-dependent enzyme [Candidatus Woesearchaeota archaeon]|nr:aminotransferase class I/II-fold pyridoxal phosphate-dependent enzyme [Candidatus Woesearchaeota archaeon]